MWKSFRGRMSGGHLRPLAATRVAASGCLLAANGCRRQEIAGGHLRPLAATRVAASGCHFQNQITRLLRAQWDFYKISMMFLWDFFGIPMVFVTFLWEFHDVSMIFPWDYYGMSEGILWDSSGISLWFLCYFHLISWIQAATLILPCTQGLHP